MNTEIRTKTANAVKHTLIFKTLGQLFAFIATILLVRALSEHEYGVYNLLYAIIGLIGTVASLGIGNTLQRYIPEYYQKGEFKIAQNLFRLTSIVRLITDAVILFIILLLWQELSPLLKINEYKNYFMLFTLVIFIHQQRNIIEIFLSSYFLHKYSKSITLVFSLVKALGYGLIIILEKNLWYIIIADLTAYTITFLLLLLAYNKKIPNSTGILNFFSKEEKKRVLRYAFFYNFNDSGVGLLNSNFDNFIIAIYLDPASVGAYSFCLRIIIQITSLFPLKYLKDVIKPAFFSLGVQADDNKKITFFFQSLVKTNLIFAIPCFFFLLIYNEQIINIFFKGKFIEHSFIMIGILLFSIINSMPIATVAQFREKADIILYSKIFALYNLIADIILIKYFGIWGAVIATGSASFFKNAFIWYFVKDAATFKGLEIFLIKIISFWAIASILIDYIGNLFLIEAKFQLLWGVIFFAIAFFMQFKCNYFYSYEKIVFTELSCKKPKLIKILKSLKML